MKICYICGSLELAGKERQTFELIKSLIKKGFVKPEQILIIAQNKNCEMYNEFIGLGVKFKNIISSFKKDFSIIWKTNKILKEFNPDIVHSYASFPYASFALLKFFRKYSFINGYIRDAISGKKTPLKNRILNKINNHFADIIIANSNAGLIAYKAPKKKSIVIHNGFDHERIKNLENKKSIKTKFKITTPHVVGMVARFCKRKDFTTFIKTAQEIIKKRKDITFLAIGDGPTLEQTKQLIKEEEEKHIKFLGLQTKVEPIINIFDIGILATNTKNHQEGISNSIMEYMALKKPVIATRGGGTSELVLNNITGFIIQPFNQQEMQEKIEFLLVNQDIAEQIGQKGKERIQQEFNIEKMTNYYLEIYNQLGEKR
jgi:glycosyltransferase involved in cell wall biosynthesis